jgi:ZIP family zinc transporter
VTAFGVFLVATATALATGLGALPFAFGRHHAYRWLGPANAVASGVMLGASTGLLIEGSSRGAVRTLVGVVAGIPVVYVSRRLVGQRAGLRLGALQGADARKALLIIGVMTAHSAAEGIGIGAAFGDTRTFGIVIAAAIAIQNIPEGLAISLVLVPRGASVRAAAAWSVFSSLPQPLLAVPAFLFVEQFTAVLPVGLGFAAGAMIWMVGTELLPEALAQTSRRVAVVTGSLSFVAMLALQLSLST